MTGLLLPSPIIYNRRLHNSGRLPYTIGKSITDYAAQVTMTGSGIVPIPYTEGIFIDYRHFDNVSYEFPLYAPHTLADD